MNTTTATPALGPHYPPPFFLSPSLVDSPFLTLGVSYAICLAASFWYMAFMYGIDKWAAYLFHNVPSLGLKRRSLVRPQDEPAGGNKAFWKYALENTLIYQCTLFPPIAYLVHRVVTEKWNQGWVDFEMHWNGAGAVSAMAYVVGVYMCFDTCYCGFLG
jgi:hypothetical protein